MATEKQNNDWLQKHLSNKRYKAEIDFIQSFRYACIVAGIFHCYNKKQAAQMLCVDEDKLTVRNDQPIDMIIGGRVAYALIKHGYTDPGSDDYVYYIDEIITLPF